MHWKKEYRRRWGDVLVIKEYSDPIFNGRALIKLWLLSEGVSWDLLRNWDGVSSFCDTSGGTSKIVIPRYLDGQVLLFSDAHTIKVLSPSYHPKLSCLFLDEVMKRVTDSHSMKEFWHLLDGVTEIHSKGSTFWFKAWRKRFLIVEGKIVPAPKRLREKTLSNLTPEQAKRILEMYELSKIE
ncbi:MAG: hypothetical protein QXT73_01250 [Candidatus Methanomethylicaceae archaeon]